MGDRRDAVGLEAVLGIANDSTTIDMNTKRSDTIMDRTDSNSSREERPLIESRWRRLRAYLRHNQEQIFIDGLLLLSWILLLSGISAWFGLPRWLFYIVLFVGVVVYTRSTPTWVRPYRSPD